VPLAELYWSTSENLHIVWINETGELSVEVTPACGGVEAGGVAVFTAPHISEGWPSLKRNG